ncbi:MAG: MFS transporter [Actinomycetota bacterium]|nr:MFS transporter [Actinomycetota bacterium]
MKARLLAPEHRHSLTLATLVLAAFSYGLQQTMVLPALPSLQQDLHTTTTWSTWIFTGFLLSSAVLTPLIGKLGDQHGKSRLLSISLAIFLVGCIGAAAAWNIWSLIAFRIVQGAGGAVFPLSFAIVKDEFPRERSGTAIGAISAVFGAAGGLGLPLSGVIVDHLSWRWLFVIAAVVVAAATVAVVTVVPESPIKTPTRLDLPGAALLSLILVTFLLALSEGQHWGWGSGRTVGLLVFAAVALAVWIPVELRVDQPLVDMRVLAGRTVALANATGFLAGFALFLAFVLVPRFVETSRSVGLDYGFGSSATQAGLFLLPGALIGLLSGPFAGRLGDRFGFRFPLALGMVITAIGLVLLAEWHDRIWQVVLGMTLAGGGVPLCFGAMAKLVVDAVRPSETGIASGLNTVMRTIGGVVGGQLGATVLANKTISGSAVPTGSAYSTAFWLGAAIAVGGVVTALAVAPLRRRAPAVAVEAE